MYQKQTNTSLVYNSYYLYILIGDKSVPNKYIINTETSQINYRSTPDIEN